MTEKRGTIVLEYLQKRDAVSREKVVAAFYPFVTTIAKRLVFDKDDLEDAIQVGMLGLIRALERFNPELDVEFATFVTPNVIGEIRHYFRDKKHLLKIPRKIQEVRIKITKLLNSEKYLLKSPTVQELAQALDEREDIVLDALEAVNLTSMASLDSPVNQTASSDKEDDRSQLLAETVSHYPSDDMVLDKTMLEGVLLILNDRERYLIELRHYKGLSQHEIGSHFGVSQMHVSRLLAAIYKKLKKKLQTGTSS